MPFGRLLYVDIQAAFIRHKTLQEILEQTLRLRSYMQVLWLRFFFFFIYKSPSLWLKLQCSMSVRLDAHTDLF